MTIEQKYFIALSELENAYIEKTKGSKAHQILRNDVSEYVEYLEKQLQQKEDIIKKAKEYIKLKLNMKNKDGFPFLLFKRTHVEKILEILDNKGE